MATIMAIGAMPSSTARSRLHRQRVRAGRMVFWVELEVEQLREVLIAANLLQQWDAEDHRAMNCAFEKAVGLWMARELNKLKDSGQL
jgi:hypothetical protein